MAANILPDRAAGFGFNQTLGVGFDPQYQSIGDPRIVTARITHINEQQELGSSFLQGNSSNVHNTLESLIARSVFGARPRQVASQQRAF